MKIAMVASEAETAGTIANTMVSTRSTHKSLLNFFFIKNTSQFPSIFPASAGVCSFLVYHKN